MKIFKATVTITLKADSSEEAKQRVLRQIGSCDDGNLTIEEVIKGVFLEEALTSAEKLKSYIKSLCDPNEIRFAEAYARGDMKEVQQLKGIVGLSTRERIMRTIVLIQLKEVA